MNTSQLITVANALVEPGKGLLAADESGPTIAKRFREIDVESTEENRLAYRRLLFTTPEIERYLSGIILFDETIRQSATDGTPLPQVLSDKGVVPGIKVDRGAKPLAGFGDEKVTEGLDGLRERLAEYYELGARFAKWRAVIAIGEGMPTTACMEANAHALARYAALCQEADIVPIVEPEVLIDGDHTIEQCRQATAETWYHLYNQMHRQDVLLEGSLLKASMVLSGKACSEQASVDEVAEETVSLARELVPAAVPGIVLRWAVAGARDTAPRCHEPSGRAALETRFLIRPRAAGTGHAGLARRRRQHRGGAAGPLPAGKTQQRSDAGPLLERHGRGGLNR